jgi:hypothetical protein
MELRVVGSVLFTAAVGALVVHHHTLRKREAGSRENNPQRKAAVLPSKLLLIGTRVHHHNTDRAPDLDQLRRFVGAASVIPGAAIAIAVSSAGERGAALLDSVQQIAVDANSSKGGGSITVLAVEPWGAFTAALNALVAHAARTGCARLLLQSVETEVTAASVQSLQQHLDANTDLVVGGVLPGHTFQLGRNNLDGRTTPWNTLALWQVSKLALTGFLGISDGLIAGVEGGVEEVAAIALLQRLLPGRACAKLVRLEGVEWRTTWTDPARREWHERKMLSKLTRPRQQLEALNKLEAGIVEHI